MHPFRAEFDRNGRKLAVRPHTATDAVPRFKDDHAHLLIVEESCGGQPGGSSANDHNLRVQRTHIPPGECITICNYGESTREQRISLHE